jgi:hypothetical protein
MSEVLKLWQGKLKLRTRDKQSKDTETYFDTPADALAGASRPAKYENEGAQVDLTIVNTQSQSGTNALVTYVIKYVIKQSMKPTEPIKQKIKKQQQDFALELETSEDTKRKAELVQKISTLAQEIAELDKKEEANSPTRHRAAAWRNLWGVRGLQWFGIQNALTPWRELRRINEKKFIHQGVERALWNRARAGDAAGFLELLGGLAAAPVAKQASCRTKLSGQTNSSGQAVKKIVGIIVKNELTRTEQEIITRPWVWTLITEYPQQQQQQQQVVQPVVVQPIVIQGVLDFTYKSITVIANHPSKDVKPKTNPKTNPKTSAVGIKPLDKLAQRHYGGQNAASP